MKQKIFPLLGISLLVLNSTGNVFAISTVGAEKEPSKLQSELLTESVEENDNIGMTSNSTESVNNSNQEMEETTVPKSSTSEILDESNNNDKAQYEVEHYGTWGTVDWFLSGDETVLKFMTSGTLGDISKAPWKDPQYGINPEDIQEIVFNNSVKTAKNANEIFSLPNLKKINGLEKLDTSPATQMSKMFANTSLTELDLTSFNTSNVETMIKMFEGAKDLRKLNLSSFNVSKTKFMDSMFTDVSLTHLTLGDQFRFKADSKLGSPISESGNHTMGTWIKDDYSTKGYSPLEFAANYGSGDLKAGTYIAERLRWGTAPWSFDEDTGVLTVEGGELGEYTTSPWVRDDEYRIEENDIKKIVFTEPVIAPSDSLSLFSYLSNLEEIEGLSFLDTSKVTNMSRMFKDSPLLTHLDIAHFNTSSVLNMGGMFEGAESLEALDLNKWDVSKVENMEAMFAGAASLQNLQLNNWDTTSVKNMQRVFFFAMSLKDLDLSNWNTVNANTESMFSFLELQRLTLGDKFKFNEETGLSNPIALHEGDTLTGNWIREDGKSKAYGPEEFEKNYGMGDLLAGSYIAETDAKSNLIVDFKATPKDIETVLNKVGETSNITINIVNNGDPASQETGMTLGKYQSIFETTSSEVTVQHIGKDGSEISKKQVPSKDFKVGYAFEDKLIFGEKLVITFEGVPWNNSKESSEKTEQIEVNYHNGSTATKAVWEDSTFVANGRFGFKNIKDPLLFRNTPLSLNLNGKLIERQKEDWSLEIEDYRGTNVNEFEKDFRANWELTASAAKFFDNENNEISPDILSVVYVKNNVVTPLGEQEVSLEQHSVEGETPKEDHDITMSWGSQEGLMAQVNQRNALRTNHEYKARVDFDLRIAP